MDVPGSSFEDRWAYVEERVNSHWNSPDSMDDKQLGLQLLLTEFLHL